MKKFFSTVYGNEKLKKKLAADISDGKFLHAYILSGPPGSGKHTIALQIAAALHCKDAHTRPCGSCENCRKILNRISPDILFFGKENGKKEFSVSIIREIRETLYITPSELEKRIYIIEDAELMNANAQNAFLKTLEEPPPFVIFILLCVDTGNLLETVKSRAPVLYTESLSDSDLRAFLLENAPGIAPERLNKIILESAGNAGYALTLYKDDEKIDRLRTLTLRFMEALTAAIPNRLGQMCDALPSDASEFLEFLQLLKYALRDAALFRYADNIPLLFFSDAEQAGEFACKITMPKLLKLIDAADLLSEKINLYMNLRLAAAAFCGDCRRILK